MSKFKFTSTKKHKLNLTDDKNEIISSDISLGVHIEMFLNKNIIIEGCKSINDYRENYIKLKIKKGFIVISGTDFIIASFNNEVIIIKGNIITIEFCV